MPTAPKQAYHNHLNPVKGWPNPAALDFVAKASADVLYDLRAGQCCHLNSSGALEPGVSLFQMPLFIFQGAAEYDVSHVTTDQWVPVTPSGNIMCIVAKAAVELETTEFVSTQTFAPNEPLWSKTGNTANDEGLNATTGLPSTSSSGVLRNDGFTWSTFYTSGGKTIVGVVSRGVFTNYNRKKMLAFWPEFIPGATASSS